MAKKKKRSQQTESALERLRSLKVGEIVTYTELQQLIGCDPQREGYGYVYAARNILRAECAFEVVDGVGIRKLSPAEVIDRKVPGRQRRIRGQMARGLAELRAIKPDDYAKLSNSHKQRHIEQLHLLGIEAFLNCPPVPRPPGVLRARPEPLAERGFLDDIIGPREKDNHREN